MVFPEHGEQCTGLHSTRESKDILCPVAYRKRLARQRKYYQLHREKLRGYAQEYYKVNKSIIRHNGKKWYEANKKRIQELGQENRSALATLKLEKGCTDCGFNSHPEALDFDHINPIKKEFTLSGGSNSRPIERLLEEVEKCVVRCANCHRISTLDNRRKDE